MARAEIYKVASKGLKFRKMYPGREPKLRDALRAIPPVRLKKKDGHLSMRAKLLIGVWYLGYHDFDVTKETKLTMTLGSMRNPNVIVHLSNDKGLIVSLKYRYR